MCTYIARPSGTQRDEIILGWFSTLDLIHLSGTLQNQAYTATMRIDTYQIQNSTKTKIRSGTATDDLTRDLTVLSRDFAVKITFDFHAKRRPQNQSNLLEI